MSAMLSVWEWKNAILTHFTFSVNKIQSAISVFKNRKKRSEILMTRIPVETCQS